MSDLIKITLKRSTIGRPKKQKITVRTLGLRKLNQSVVHKRTPQIEGMIRKVIHLVELERV